ncbi:MAG TPA: hypothetical protein VER33_19925 [Polyangiaceae bacterium]|nr:hypothetical protein [Polyangiaceae bacterium]
MKRKFEELREDLEEFVEQTDYPVLIVGCLSNELAYVCKLIQDVDQQYPAELARVEALEQRGSLKAVNSPGPAGALPAAS